jgi:hypothetical protein
MLIILKKILKLTQVIVQQCNDEQWENMEASQTKRATLMAELEITATPSTAEDIDKCKLLSFDIQKLNDKILQLSKKNKHALFDEIRLSNKSKKMNTAYGK